MDQERSIQRIFSSDDYYIRGLNFVNEHLLPHLGTGLKHEKEIEKKAIHIGHMVNRVVQAYLGLIPCDDRDHVKNKRYDLPGPLIANLLKK